MNHNDIVCFDFETGGLDPNFHEAIEVAGKAYNARTLEPYPPEEGGEFVSLMRPMYPERLEEGALRVNKRTREELMAAPEQKLVWNQFVTWVNRWNPRRNIFGAPIAAGKNIRDFDLKFVATLCKLHCKQGEKTMLFNRRTQLDLEDFLFHWFENESEPSNFKMDTIREFMGLSTDGAHGALVDTQQTGDLIMRFLKIYRTLQKRQGRDGGRLIKFKAG